jgi:hypothetical protein
MYIAVFFPAHNLRMGYPGIEDSGIPLTLVQTAKLIREKHLFPQ